MNKPKEFCVQLSVRRALFTLWALLGPHLPAFAAEPEAARESAVVLPVVKVTAARLERYGVLNQKFVDRDGQGMWKLVVWHVPTSSDMFSMLIGVAHLGDEIVSINGRDVTTIPKGERVELLRGDFKVVVKRQAGRRSFRLLELDGRGKEGR
jgi:hypothetical protein